MKTNQSEINNLTFKDNTQNAYLLFVHEVIDAIPNCDPYSGQLRMIEEQGILQTSDVHIKHHNRRGVKASGALDYGLKQPENFYEKKDPTTIGGKSRSQKARIDALKESYPSIKNPKDIFQVCLDLPLFGFVNAKEGESFACNGAVGMSFMPSSFHTAYLTSIGKNNAFAAEGKSASGSASVVYVSYSLVMTLLEINIPALKDNIKDHKVLKGGDFNQWMNLLAKGLWRAYTTHRYPSSTQRGQYAKFILGWNPKNEMSIDPIVPRDLFDLLEDPKIKNKIQGKEGLKKVLPVFLKGWQYSPETEAGRIQQGQYLDEILGEE